jgi:ubiquinone/menaquinone biosynthesis C-methylase UbiE
MPFDLEYGRRVYDRTSRHPRLYALIRWSVCLGRESGLQQLAIDALNLQSGQTVLDLACGNGVNFKHLAAIIGQRGKIFALDYSTGMLANAQRHAASHGLPNFQFIHADAARVCLKPNSLDAALCTFGLSAMPGERHAIQNVARALKPGARFVVFDAKPFTGLARIWNPILGPFFARTQNWNPHKDVVKALRENFTQVNLRQFNSGCNFIAVAAKPAYSDSHK